MGLTRITKGVIKPNEDYQLALLQQLELMSMEMPI